MDKRSEDRSSSNAMKGYDPTNRNFQRNDKETDISKSQDSEGVSEEEIKHGTGSPKGSSGPEEKDVTV